MLIPICKAFFLYSQPASDFPTTIFPNELSFAVTSPFAAVCAGELAPYNNKANLLAPVEKRKIRINIMHEQTGQGIRAWEKTVMHDC